MPWALGLAIVSQNVCRGGLLENRLFDPLTHQSSELLFQVVLFGTTLCTILRKKQTTQTHAFTSQAGWVDPNEAPKNAN